MLLAALHQPWGWSLPLAALHSYSLFAMSATAVMCFTSRVVSWAASPRIVPVSSWTTWVLSFLPVLLFFVVLASPFSWFSLLPFTSARGTHRFFPVFEAEDFLLALGFGSDEPTVSCPSFTSSLCCFWISNDLSMKLLSSVLASLDYTGLVHNGHGRTWFNSRPEGHNTDTVFFRPCSTKVHDLLWNLKELGVVTHYNITFALP